MDIKADPHRTEAESYSLACKGSAEDTIRCFLDNAKASMSERDRTLKIDWFTRTAKVLEKVHGVETTLGDVRTIIKRELLFYFVRAAASKRLEGIDMDSIPQDVWVERLGDARISEIAQVHNTPVKRVEQILYKDVLEPGLLEQLVLRLRRSPRRHPWFDNLYQAYSNDQQSTPTEEVPCLEENRQVIEQALIAREADFLVPKNIKACLYYIVLVIFAGIFLLSTHVVFLFLLPRDIFGPMT